MREPSCGTCRFQHWTAHLTDPVGFCKNANVGPSGVPMVTCFTARHTARPSRLRLFFGAMDWCGPEGHYHAAKAAPLPDTDTGGNGAP